MQNAMSALHPKADMCSALAYVRFAPESGHSSGDGWHVRFVPIADLRPCRIGDIVRYDLRSHEVVVAR